MRELVVVASGDLQSRPEGRETSHAWQRERRCSQARVYENLPQLWRYEGTMRKNWPSRRCSEAQNTPKSRRPFEQRDDSAGLDTKVSSSPEPAYVSLRLRH